MNKFQSSFLREAFERGFIQQGTNLGALDQVMAEKKITAYIGFDPTADGLHVGSMVQIMWLRLLQKHGHKPIAVMGGATAKIGDPSGKDEMRQFLTEEKLQHNIRGIQAILKHFIDFDKSALLLNNDDWTKDLKYIEFLRQYGQHFTINRMLTFDSVRLRLEREQPLTFLEFNYMLLQAYDYLVLCQREDCTLQLGGSDQWGNIVNGVELVRRIEGKEVYGVVSPLVTTASGVKMGKTAQGAIWLTAEKLKPFDFWQYWRNTDDADVGRFLRLFTDLPLDKIEELETLQDSEINEAKKVLADEVTRLCHGEKAVHEAREAAKTLFEGQQGDRSALPQFHLSSAELARGIRIIDLFVRSQLCESLGEARRLIKGQGARLNDAVLVDGERQLSTEDFDQDNSLKFSAGKKRHMVIILK